MKDPRITAANILYEVIVEKKSLSQILHKANDSTAVSLTKELCFGVCRYYFQLECILEQLLQKKIKAQEKIIEILLLLGIYELLYLNTAKYAVVSEIVNCIKSLKKNWAIKLGNAVLRNFLRNKEHILLTIKKDQQAELAQPKWLITELKKAWPLCWYKILEQSNHAPPMIVRVNQRLITTEDYQALLNKKNIRSQKSEVVCSALILEKACHVSELPGFTIGYCSVQDVSAQLAVSFLQLAPNFTVLDACAAPGGKTTQILEAEENLASLIALDSDAERIIKIQENLTRLKFIPRAKSEQFHATVKTARAENLEEWWDGNLFDRILLDAPCSATGVIRRHPDIKLLRKKEDIKTLINTQRTLLSQLWKVLKPEGLLLYVTCSILPPENSENIQWFLETQKNVRMLPLDFPINHSQLGLQLFPGDFSGDGFYYCLLQKIF